VKKETKTGLTSSRASRRERGQLRPLSLMWRSRSRLTTAAATLAACCRAALTGSVGGSGTGLAALGVYLRFLLPVGVTPAPVEGTWAGVEEVEEEPSEEEGGTTVAWLRAICF